MTKLTGIPNPQLALEVKNVVDNKLLQSFDYLLQIAEKGIHIDTKNIRNKLNACKDSKLNSLAYLYHTKLKQLINKQDSKGVEELLPHLEEVGSFKSEGVRLGSIKASFFSDFDNQTLLEIFKYGYQTTYKKEPDLHAMDTEIAMSHIDQAKYAIEVLKQIDPLSYKEIQGCVSEILIYESEFMNSGSSFNTLGLITMNKLIDKQNWTTYLEIIIHEAAHLHLYNLMVVDKLFENQNERYYSPLRKEKRPMIGIFHGMFVLSRIIRSFNLLEDYYADRKDKPEIVYSYNNSKNDSPHIVKFESLYNTVIQNAVLTTWGKKIVADCKEMVNKNCIQQGV